MRSDRRLTLTPAASLFVMAAAMVLVFAACGSDAAAPSGSAPESSVPTPTPADGATSSEAPAPTEPAAAEDDASDGDGDGDGAPAESGDEPELYPDVLNAEFTESGDGTWTVSVTLSSPYDTPERYADAWRLLDEDGNELGIRELAHDHQSEQPFTRSLSGVEIPDDVSVITVQGRDQVSGWGGVTIEVPAPG